jgi:hypothetical protein
VTLDATIPQARTRTPFQLQDAFDQLFTTPATSTRSDHLFE